MKIFVDLMSQPCRAVVLLLEINKIPYTKVIINLANGDHQTNEEFAKINPNKTVPALSDDSVSLYESGTIMRYICGKYSLLDHWYPKNLQKRALVDQYLDWHHTKLRTSSRWFFRQYLMNNPASDPAIINIKELLKKAMCILNDNTLNEHKFIAGDSISVADLQALCELTQHWAVGRDIFYGFANLEKWAKNCIEVLQPSFDEVHKVIYLVKNKKVFGIDPTPLQHSRLESKL